MFFTLSTVSQTVGSRANPRRTNVRIGVVFIWLAAGQTYEFGIGAHKCHRRQMKRGVYLWPQSSSAVVEICARLHNNPDAKLKSWGSSGCLGVSFPLPSSVVPFCSYQCLLMAAFHWTFLHGVFESDQFSSIPTTRLQGGWAALGTPRQAGYECG